MSEERREGLYWVMRLDGSKGMQRWDPNDALSACFADGSVKEWGPLVDFENDPEFRGLPTIEEMCREDQGRDVGSQPASGSER